MTDSKSKPYHTQCTGKALATVQATAARSDDEAKDKITLFGACFCPFVQRAWATLCFLRPPTDATAPWQYYECDPYAKPAELLELSPKGLVPALRLEHNDDYKENGGVRGICESTVIMDYLLDRFRTSPTGETLLPPSSTHAYERAQHRIAADRVNRTLIPAFYRFLQAQDADKQAEHGRDFVAEVEAFLRGMDVVVPTSRDRASSLDAAAPARGKGEREGEGEGIGKEGHRSPPRSGGGFWDGSHTPSLVDFTVAPWLYRATNVLAHYRSLDLARALDPALLPRWQAWSHAVFTHPAWEATVSDETTYLESYARYAENRPNTSQVANAINQGRGLP